MMTKNPIWVEFLNGHSPKNKKLIEPLHCLTIRNVKLQKGFDPNVYCTGVAITVTSMTDIVVFAVGSSTVSSIHFIEKRPDRKTFTISSN